MQVGFGVNTLLSLFVGWSFMASGIAAWVRRPENPVGTLMVAIGLMWFVAQLLRHWGGSIGAHVRHLARRPVAAAACLPAGRLPADAARGTPTA